jgi:rfaE bifunctional protein nucleotidyltransferase chain/domain
MRNNHKTVVVTNGCFDLLHAGHVAYLENARNLGDVLLVGLNNDLSVRQLKGPLRPLNNESDRARLIAALEAVSAVCIFPEIRASRFLRDAHPDVYVKGGDFKISELPPEELLAAQQCGARIHTLTFLPGKSTTALLNKIHALPHHPSS